MSKEYVTTMSVERQKEVDRLFAYLVEVYINLTESWREMEKGKHHAQNMRALITMICRKSICIPNKNSSCLMEDDNWLPFERQCSTTNCQHKHSSYDNFRIRFTIDNIGKTLESLLDMRRFCFQFMCLLSRSRGLKVSTFNNPHLVYLTNRMIMEYGFISARNLFTRYTGELDIVQVSLRGLFKQMESFNRDLIFLHSFDESWLLRILNYFLLEMLCPGEEEKPEKVKNRKSLI